MFILSLPDEVLSQAFHYLDCWGILAVRLTCWRLYAISRSRLLWQTKALESSYSSAVPLLEEPVENYTSIELEEKVITRVRTSQKWRKLDPSCFQWRKIAVDCRDRNPSDLKLLPGGRWLLFNLKGCVSIMDLDAPNSTWEPLFDVADSVGTIPESTIWIDPTKCWLSPRMALHCRNAAIGKDLRQIWIYQLNSTGRGLNMKWSAEKLAIIRTSALGMTGKLQLEKKYFLERCIHLHGRSSFWRAYLYQYSDCHLRSCNWDSEEGSTTLLLPGNRIGTITLPCIRLSVIEPVGLGGLRLQPTFSTLLDWIPLWPRNLKLHSTLHYSYFNITSQDSMLEIQFSHDANEVYQKRMMFARDPVSSAAEGSCLLVLQFNNSCIDCIPYKPEEGGTRQVASQIRVCAGPFPGELVNVGCDITSGRLLFETRNREPVLLQV